MKIYYIDDTLFQESSFQEEIRHRFLHHLRRNEVALILISSAHGENKNRKIFLNECKNIPIVSSPCCFDVAGIKGNLHTAFLNLEGFPCVSSYSGTCVEFNIDKGTYERIYLDMFVDFHEEENFDYLVEELEKVLQEKVEGLKKKNEFIN